MKGVFSFFSMAALLASSSAFGATNFQCNFGSAASGVLQLAVQDNTLTTNAVISQGLLTRASSMRTYSIKSQQQSSNILSIVAVHPKKHAKYNSLTATGDFDKIELKIGVKDPNHDHIKLVVDGSQINLYSLDCQ